MADYKYGILLPHFGSEARRERIVEDSVRIENYGFDSVWVRDHLIYHPHEYEDQNRTFIDPFVALSAIAAVTKKITLATGALIPHRNPVHAALLVGSLDFIAGPGRLVIGWGDRHLFARIRRRPDDWLGSSRSPAGADRDPTRALGRGGGDVRRSVLQVDGRADCAGARRARSDLVLRHFASCGSSSSRVLRRVDSRPDAPERVRSANDVRGLWGFFCVSHNRGLFRINWIRHHAQENVLPGNGGVIAGGRFILQGRHRRAGRTENPRHQRQTGGSREAAWRWCSGPPGVHRGPAAFWAVWLRPAR